MAKLYFVSYDLVRQRNYQPLYDELARLGAKRMLESLWFLTNASSAEQIRDHLTGFIDGDDRLAVIACTGEWASLRAKATPNG